MATFSLNVQDPEKRISRDSGAIDVVDVFYTIQGEGPFAGTPAVFVRLAGCNLKCPACDTNYTKGRRVFLVPELIRKIREVGPGRYYREMPLVVITGGEPFRQACGPLVRDLSFSGFRVQFETNGTMYDETMENWWREVTVVCSPKTPQIHEKMIPHITHLKYVLEAGQVDPDDGLPTSALLNGLRPFRPNPLTKIRTYVQPCDEVDPKKNKRNMQAAIDSCQRYGYTLCVQVHKIVGLP